MSDLFQNFSENVSNGSAADRKPYSLNEDLAIMDMINSGVSLKDISGITNRTVNSLRYRYKDKTRGVRKILAEGGPEALFTKAGEEFKGEEDVQARIEAFKASIEPAA